MGASALGTYLWGWEDEPGIVALAPKNINAFCMGWTLDKSRKHS